MCSSPKRRDGCSQELKHTNQEFLLKRTNCIVRDMPGTLFFSAPRCSFQLLGILGVDVDDIWDDS
jgi:hypothetical protein